MYSTAHEYWQEEASQGAHAVQGAVLPGLGTFYAAAQNQYKQSECVPSFYLQERTFRGVSHEAPRAASAYLRHIAGQ